MTIRITLVLSVLIATFTLFTACKKKEEIQKSIVSVKGSDTMVNLSQKWAETYMQKNPNASIQVTGGGSGTGIAQRAAPAERTGRIHGA